MHCGLCSKDENAWWKRRDERRYYASDYSGACFKHSPDFAKYLTANYCQLPTPTDLRVDFDRKLRTLLEQDDYKTEMARVSERMLGEADSWTTLSWDDSFARSVAIELEIGFSESVVNESATALPTTLVGTLKDLIIAGMKHSKLEWAMPIIEDISSLPHLSTNNVCVPAQEGSSLTAEGWPSVADEIATRNRQGCQGGARQGLATQGPASLSSYTSDSLSRQDYTRQHTISAMADYTSTIWNFDYASESQARTSPQALDHAYYGPSYLRIPQGTMVERAVSPPQTIVHWDGYYTPHFDASEAAPTPPTDDFYPCWP